MRKTLLSLSLSLILFSCKKVDNEETSTFYDLDTAAVAVDTSANYSTPTIRSWEYDKYVDEMTSNTTKIATITSNESISLDFPYDGINYGHIQLRKKNGDLDIMILIDKGQISTEYDNQNISVRFDDAKPITFNYIEPSDNSSDVIFIDNETKFLSKLKKSRKTLIALPLYQGGTQVLKFNTENLEW